MLILVANLGSTSFKFKLLDMSLNGKEVARGGYERIGQGEYKDHAAVIDVILAKLEKKPDAIGFKAVHGGPISGAVRVDEKVIETMQAFADIAPAHNPPYIAAMKAFAQKLPGVPQVAAFETGFHQPIPLGRQIYGIPWEWTEKLGIRRYGFHGASHRYVATRLCDETSKLINCHLGGSSSVCGIQGTQSGPVSAYNSLGLTPQTGVFHNNRVGDFDTFALVRLLKHGLSVDEVLTKLSKESGLLGISGISNDMRDIEKAANEGNERAKLAFDAFVESVRHHIGAAMMALNGCDALSFSGGIGENSSAVRAAVCRGLNWAGIVLDPEKNNSIRGREELISSPESEAEIWIVPTNEELVVARQTQEVLG